MTNEITIKLEDILACENHSITDCETIRQISLLGRTLKTPVANAIYDKVKPSYYFCGLYPDVINEKLEKKL